jgi:hypothetical protein
MTGFFHAHTIFCTASSLTKSYSVYLSKRPVKTYPHPKIKIRGISFE